ncbi:MAG TPA: hypothetical protein VFB06_37260 [Streptosporangiaceae bacterium]|nr:hypothetical protein [Streptosporangiaceae bacterium]
MSCQPPGWSTRVFAAPRLDRYQQAARSGGVHAFDLYRWNLQVSEAFYPALSCLEISLRNALHSQLRIRYGREDWWAVARLDGHDDAKVRQATDDLRARQHTSVPCADGIVAELSLGFWVSLLSRRYDRYLWVPALHRSFPGYHGRRERLHDSFDSVRRFRNRIMHHEPVHHRHLAADHQKIYRLLGYIEPLTVTWLMGFDRVPAVLAARPGQTAHAR